MSEAGSPDSEQIHVVNSFQKEVESLERSFKEMLQTLQEGERESPQATLQHVLLLDHGVEQASVRRSNDNHAAPSLAS